MCKDGTGVGGLLRMERWRRPEIYGGGGDGGHLRSQVRINHQELAIKEAIKSPETGGGVGMSKTLETKRGLQIGGRLETLKGKLV